MKKIKIYGILQLIPMLLYVNLHSIVFLAVQSGLLIAMMIELIVPEPLEMSDSNKEVLKKVLSKVDKSDYTESELESLKTLSEMYEDKKVEPEIVVEKEKVNHLLKLKSLFINS